MASCQGSPPTENQTDSGGADFPHKWQSKIVPSFSDKFESGTTIYNETMITNIELEQMYLVEDKQFCEKYEEYINQIGEHLKKQDVGALEQTIAESKHYKNGIDTWDFFWEGLTYMRTRDNQPLLPPKEVPIYSIIMNSFGDYERMREMYAEAAGITLGEFVGGQRAEARKDQKYHGWLWVLYNTETDLLEIESADDETSYLSGKGNGLLHPVLVMDKFYATQIPNIHTITNWHVVQKRILEAKDRQYVLVTGGSGYIGSHTVVELVQKQNEHVIIVDNLDNSMTVSTERVKFITGKPDYLVFHQVDLKNATEMEEKIFKRYKIKSVIHFAALKAVFKSISSPLDYYDNNVGASIKLMMLMKKYQVNVLVFSSSATVYGDNPLADEDAPIGPINPYGQTKSMIEQVMKDYAASNPEAVMIALRYFNPIGNHASGLIGEDPKEEPNNLLPYIQRVAVGALPFLKVFGNDYDTVDGTGVRDYIHVTDLAKGHTAALRASNVDVEKPLKGFQAFNLGTGQGTSVLELKDAFQAASGVEIKYEIQGRRAGDSRQVLAIPDRANQVLDWKTELTVADACAHGWKWVSMNPNGFGDK